VLPPAFAGDGERLNARREARLLATVNHPASAAITGSSRVRRALVLELIEGDTLARHLTRGLRSRLGNRRSPTRCAAPARHRIAT
jgi:hypothetical protein